MEKLRINVSLDLHWITWLTKMQERTMSHTTSETIRKIFTDYQRLLTEQDRVELERITKGVKSAKIVR